MALVITQGTTYININWGAHSVNLSKADLVVERLDDYIYLGSESDDYKHKILYSDVKSPTYGSALIMEAALLAMKNNQGGQSQVFVATLNQTTFTTMFTCVSGSTLVFVNGSQVTTGWSVIGGAVVFSPTIFTGGESVVIILL